MQQKLKIIPKLIGVLTLFMLTNCSKDEFVNNSQNSKDKNNITFEQFKKETGLSNFENKISINQSQTITLEKKSNEVYDLSKFSIDTTIVKKLEKDKKTTYTFKIRSTNVLNDKIYNLTMFYKKGWQTIIVELKPTKENLLLLKQGLKVKYDGTMTRLYQSDIPNVGLQSRSAQTTCTTIFVEYWHCTGTGQCSSGTCDQCNLCVGYESYSMCGSGPVGPGPLYIDAGGSTGGGGGGSSTQTNNEAIAIIPNLDQLNPYVDGYIEFNLDIDASSKSPFNIDRSGITDATPEGIKFNTVYDALLESPKFQELFENLFGNSDRFNVIFQIGSVANGARGNTNTDLFNPTLNTITISPDFIKNNSKLVVAKTILHECIHAYLNVKLCDGGQGMSIPNINNQDFYNIVNQKYNYFAPGENQHNFIYNFMLPTMQTILLDVKDTLVSPTDNAEIMASSIYPNSPVLTPRILFNWDDCLFNLALGGLQSCAFFQNEIGTFNLDGTINTIIDIIKMNNYNQYITLCQTTLH